MIEIYVGGTYNRLANMGGWGVVLVEEGKREKKCKGSESGGTHQRMILKAAVEGLVKTEEGCEAKIFSNNEILVLGIEDSQQRRANRDLWEQLDDLMSSRNVQAKYIARHQWLNEARILAKEAAGS
jgi:ribonuclease HI